MKLFLFGNGGFAREVWAYITSFPDGLFMDGYGTGINGTWIGALRSYYHDPKIRCCPTATKPMSEGSRGTFAAWGVFGSGLPSDDPGWSGPKVDGDYGSYGMNELAYNTPQGAARSEHRWRTINVKGASEIPMLFDCIWFDVYPLDTDNPPDYPGDVVKAGGGGEKALGRHAVAALLNAASGYVGFYYTEAEVIAIVQAAYAPGGDFEAAKNLLEAQNDPTFCPLD